MPAAPPAAAAGQRTSKLRRQVLSLPIKLVAAEAGFFPPGPLTFLADMLRETRRRKGKKGHKGRKREGRQIRRSQNSTVTKHRLRTVETREKVKAKPDVRHHCDD